jgi:hypothetical protein
MTEAEWNVCRDPITMLDFLRASGKASDRKWRLFACACCRHVWDRFPDPRNRDLVAAAEEYPNGAFEDPEFHSAIVASSAVEGACRDHPAYWIAKHLGRGFYKWPAAVSAFSVACKVLSIAAGEHAREFEVETGVALVGARYGEAFRLPSPLPEGAQAEGRVLAGIVRDVFGPMPFRSTTIDPSLLKWNDRTVHRIAQGIYDERAFERMGVLADALLDAGCANEEILQHCHEQEQVHVRGCWVLDLLLGKA